MITKRERVTRYNAVSADVAVGDRILAISAYTVFAAPITVERIEVGLGDYRIAYGRNGRGYSAEIGIGRGDDLIALDRPEPTEAFKANPLARYLASRREI